MLRSFRLENHRSFRDEAELVLLPVYRDSSESRDLPIRVAAVYGANAAGKSNLLDGLQFMAEALGESYRSWTQREGVPRRAFRLHPEAAQEPSTYVVEVELASVRYTYGFVVDDRAFREEWLYSYPKGKRRRLFEREGMTVELGESLGVARGKASVVAELMRPNALFLSMIAQFRDDEFAELRAVHDWFVTTGIAWSRPSHLRASRDLRAMNQRLVDFVRDDADRTAAIRAFVQAADVGVDDIVVEESPPPPPATASAGDDLDLRKPPRPQFKLRHGGATLFNLWDESDGTLAWLNLLPGALTALADGGLLVVDEIDSSLHPNLTALLIQQFRSAETNPRRAQLLFTTHDAALLGTSFGEEILGRDEVWFVEKEADGASRLYPLSDFRPRAEGENRERRYLGGSYGAVPVLGDPAPAPGGPARTKVSDS